MRRLRSALGLVLWTLGVLPVGASERLETEIAPFSDDPRERMIAAIGDRQGNRLAPDAAALVMKVLSFDRPREELETSRGNRVVIVSDSSDGRFHLLTCCQAAEWWLGGATGWALVDSEGSVRWRRASPAEAAIGVPRVSSRGTSALVRRTDGIEWTFVSSSGETAGTRVWAREPRDGDDYLYDTLGEAYVFSPGGERFFLTVTQPQREIDVHCLEPDGEQVWERRLSVSRPGLLIVRKGARIVVYDPARVLVSPDHRSRWFVLDSRGETQADIEVPNHCNFLRPVASWDGEAVYLLCNKAAMLHTEPGTTRRLVYSELLGQYERVAPSAGASSYDGPHEMNVDTGELRPLASRRDMERYQKTIAILRETYGDLGAVPQ